MLAFLHCHYVIYWHTPCCDVLLVVVDFFSRTSLVIPIIITISHIRPCRESSHRNDLTAMEIFHKVDGTIFQGQCTACSIVIVVYMYVGYIWAIVRYITEL